MIVQNQNNNNTASEQRNILKLIGRCKGIQVGGNVQMAVDQILVPIR